MDILIKSALLFALMGCQDDPAIQANHRFNFEVCMQRCADAGVLGKYEQGLGYVRCDCASREPKP